MQEGRICPRPRRLASRPHLTGNIHVTRRQSVLLGWMTAAIFWTVCASNAGAAVASPTGVVTASAVAEPPPSTSDLSKTLQQLASKYGICNVTAAVIQNRRV